jgi:hypothetical protein
MENIIILLACVVMTTAAGNYKLFKIEKTEKVEVVNGTLILPS